MKCSCPGLVAQGGINLGKYPGEKVNWAIALRGFCGEQLSKGKLIRVNFPGDKSPWGNCPGGI